MFYSHQILARKGPLATVWMAAHLQHRLKKPHYNSVDINSTIDRIIWPEAPIALRMSGHLLLGVVRIYSKKVEYLYNDCNDAMVKVSKAFTPAEVNVTEAPAVAPVDEVTLPERFELDALNMDDVFRERGVDSFMRSPEDITLPDSTPVNMDHYVAVTFEDLDMTPTVSSFQGLGRGQERDTPEPAGSGNGTELASEGLPGVSGSGFQPMEEDEHLRTAGTDQTPTVETRTFLDPGPSYQPGATIERSHEQQTPQSIEVMRHAVLDSTLPDLPMPFQTADEAVQQKADVTDKEKEFVSPIAEELLESGEQPLSFQPHQMHASVAEESPNLFGSHLSFGQGSVELAIRSTPSVRQVHVPPVEVAPRRNKRKLYDEKAIVLSNKALKDALNDTSKIVRKKRRLPDSFIGSWRLEKIRKEHIFTGPLLTGMCEELYDICTDLSTNSHLARIEEPTQEVGDRHTPERPDASANIATQLTEGENEGELNTQVEQEGDHLRSPVGQPTTAPDREAEHSPRHTSDNGSGSEEKGEEGPLPPTELDMEVERLRRDEGDAGPSMVPEFTPAVLLSPTREDTIPAVSAGSFKSGQEGQSSLGPGLFPTPELASSAETLGQGVGAYDPHQMEQPSFGDVPELIRSPGTDELHFLDADSSVTGTRGTQDANSLCVRTRGAAQYFKNKLSPGTPSSVDQSATFSLNVILQDQPRKRCARMFYETLVLKSYDLIDVEQNESYGDIILRMTPALKAQL